jgi:hypothetical protein
MAIGKKTGGRDFKPGNKSNGGRRAIAEEIRQIRADLSRSLVAYVKKYWNLSTEEIKIKIADPTLTMGEQISLKFISNARTKSDTAYLKTLSDLFGLEAAMKIDLSSSDGTMSPVNQDQMKEIAKAYLDSK